jgi:hypothetical protein
MSTVTLRRQWRARPDPIDGIRPMVFSADASDLAVSDVHVFPLEDCIALSFITALGSINVTLPAQLAREIGSGLLRLTAHDEQRDRTNRLSSNR